MLKNIWPFSKYYRLKDEISKLNFIIKNQNDDLKKDINDINNKLISSENNLLFQINNLREKKNILQTNFRNISEELDGIYHLILKCQKEILNLQDTIDKKQKKFEEYKKYISDDLWFTKYGYDWMISDLQMRCIEEVIPGNREKLLSLKNTHIGETCFVIGNGPSLQAKDLSKLKENNIFCFASKRINLIFDETDWRPDIWGVSDLDYIQLYKDEISKLKGFPKLICAQSVIKHDIIIDDALYYPFIQMERQPPWFNADIMRGVHFWGTITCKLINFAVYMGFKKIYLLGVDHTFPIMKNKDGKLLGDPTKMEHFSKFYHSEEEIKQVVKNVDDIIKSKEYMDQSYHSVKWYCEQLGVEIINATRGGELEEFTRISFDDVFK